MTTPAKPGGDDNVPGRGDGHHHARQLGRDVGGAARFTGVTIPPGSTVTAATYEVDVYDLHANARHHRIWTSTPRTLITRPLWRRPPTTSAGEH
jgi:hypothetical protein